MSKFDHFKPIRPYYQNGRNTIRHCQNRPNCTCNVNYFFISGLTVNKDLLKMDNKGFDAGDSGQVMQKVKPSADEEKNNNEVVVRNA